MGKEGVSHISAWFRHAIPANTKHVLLPDKQFGTRDGRLRRLKTTAFLARRVIKYSVVGVPQMPRRLITKDSDYARESLWVSSSVNMSLWKCTVTAVSQLRTKQENFRSQQPIKRKTPAITISLIAASDAAEQQKSVPAMEKRAIRNGQKKADL
ncbi:hypothetical protein CDAR_584771 [Caerostris darwini]|uniref:Uncharacterized protein n=1 Tax=Caerostris darwini TaxID=1538125 RepID=A0AAV4QT40_9ARAC|nr:hypothetical protein CDAR_584771 [Caerostris darwini]